MSQRTKVVAQYLLPVSCGYFVLAVFLFKGTVPAADDLLKYLGGAAGLTLVASLAQDIVPRSFKEALVFAKIKDRLPGHRAFSDRFRKSDRFHSSRITNIEELSRLPGADQQRLFYSLYRSHSADPRVEHYSFRYLAWRDCCSTLFLLTIVSIPVLGGYPTFTQLLPASKLAMSSLAACAATAMAARQTANELVVLVLAAETEKGSHDVPK
jgi:hypothetical protein